MTISNAMSVDVEDYFQVSAFDGHIHRSQWDSLPHRVLRNTNIILDLFAENNTQATFFVLGWVAERYPELVRRIVAEGHELASHGYGHERATQQSRAEFKEDISKARKILQDLSALDIKGYRAPSYSINKSNLWVHDELLEAGYQYSSSIYPVKHDLYGIPDAPRFAYKCENGLLEIPITTTQFAGRNLPAGGGGFFRLYPYVLSRKIIQRVNQKDQQAAIFYFHPWELDPQQPKQKGVGLKSRFRHYLNLHKTEKRLIRLLTDFNWQRMDTLFLKDPA